MKLYFMGICGTAMGNAALLLRSAGHEVSGSDDNVYPPMSDVLAAAGIGIRAGYDPERLATLMPDLVIVGNAMSRGNPEVEWLLDSRAFPIASLPEALRRFVLGKRRNVVVCGTHGKTTTTSIAAHLLRENGRDPGYLIGGVPQDPPSGNHLGGPGEVFVIEGDEYDSAFFDKRSKFIHYEPHVGVINNLEFDHADIFRDLADVQRAFSHFTRIVPRGGFIVVNGDDANIRALGPTPWTRVVRVGTGGDNDARIHDFSETGEGAGFSLTWRGEPWAEVRWSLPGLFNARNAAMAATAAGLAAGAAGVAPDPRWLQLESLARFRGVRRRQEVLFESAGLVVIEDFGHHPTAIAETLGSLRARFPGATLTAAFEPRSNTARINALQEDFTRALGCADEAYLGPVSRGERLDASVRFDPGSVAAELSGQGKTARAFPGSAELLEGLCAATLVPGAPRRVVVFFSNGSFDGIIAAYAARARLKM